MYHNPRLGVVKSSLRLGGIGNTTSPHPFPKSLRSSGQAFLRRVLLCIGESKICKRLALLWLIFKSFVVLRKGILGNFPALQN